MSRSQPKPKIIYKNLQDVIKSSTLTKNNSNKKYNTQRLNTQSQSQTQVLTDISNVGNKDINKNGYSLQLKKTKYIQVHRNQQENNDQNQNNMTNTSVHLYSKCYNQIDAIFTELEDYFYQSKDKVLDQVRIMLRNKQGKNKGNNNNNKIQQKVQDIKKMSEYIKHITNYFVNGQVPDLQPSPQQQVCYAYSKNSSNTMNTKNTVFTQAYDDQSSKMLSLSMKNSKVRANRRGQLINNRKKTVYELILEERENKIRLSTSMSKKAL